MNHSSVKSLVAVLVAAAGLLLGAQSAQASARTWSGGANNVNLSTSGNWDTTPISGDSWTFTSANGSQGLTLNNDFSGFSVAGITFNSGALQFTIGKQPCPTAR